MKIKTFTFILAAVAIMIMIYAKIEQPVQASSVITWHYVMSDAPLTPTSVPSWGSGVHVRTLYGDGVIVKMCQDGSTSVGNDQCTP